MTTIHRRVSPIALAPQRIQQILSPLHRPFTNLVNYEVTYEKIESLDLTDCQSFLDPNNRKNKNWVLRSFLPRCHHLKTLDLGSFPLTDQELTVLPPHLRMLRCSSTHLKTPDFRRFTHLQYVKLSHSQHIKLPLFINLPQIRIINLSDAKNLGKLLLHNLPNLQRLVCDGCINLESVTNYDGLKHLSLYKCGEYRDFSFENMRQLETLDVSQTKVRHLGVSYLHNLKQLACLGCENLQDPNLRGLDQLELLILNSCHSLLHPRIEGLPSLEELHISGCNGIKSLHLRNLPNLRMVCCDSLPPGVEIISENTPKAKLLRIKM